MKTSTDSGARRRNSGRESCSAAQRPGAVERFAGAHPPHYRGSPPLTRPRMAMPFDRPPASGLFAPRISDTNKWCKSTSRKHQEAELRTRIAKHLSGRVRLPGADTYTHHETVSEQNPRHASARRRNSERELRST